MLADVLGDGEDADEDGDKVIVLSMRWSGHGPGDAGTMPRECRLDLLLMSRTTMAPLWVLQKVYASGPSVREPTWANANADRHHKTEP